MPVFVILQPAKVATPLALAVTDVDVQEKPTDGLPVTESTTEAPDTKLPPASVPVTAGCDANATPATVVADGWVENANVATGPTAIVIELLATVMAPAVAVSV